ncbi:MAG: hypothetical protein WCC36_06390 [Gammaproteobacteria bacterium]
MRAVIISLLGAAGLAACAAQPVSQGTSITLKPMNNSGESGTAMLTAEGRNTKVVIALANTPPGVTQPAHIHAGTCSDLNPRPLVGLHSVTGGGSTSVVPLPLTSLLSAPYAINVHKSQQDIGSYVACGDIASAAPYGGRSQPGLGWAGAY